MSWWSKHVTHAVSRMLGGPSYAEKRERQSLLEQAEEAQREADTRKDILSRLRKMVRSGRRSLLSWFDDDSDTIGA
ncbi:MAG: hypothetical protein LBC42_00090 [Puniceicoccales bacterium]|jgi:hypothetical protein|nr:hypothetical protein [Puniceicoccales bacterium]